MNKIKIRICVGTSCFVMGSAQIQSLEFNAPADIADHIEIVEERCMGLCREIAVKHNHGPFVFVDDELIESATYEKVVAKIREKLKKIS